MTEPTTPETRLWTPAGFREDEWTHAEGAEALSGNGRFILPLQAFLDLDPEVRRSARERLGVVLQPGDQLEKIADFSKGELLRERHHFEGAVRATGQVLVDQLPHMLRLGFDEFEISNPVLLKRLEEGRTGGLGLYYQPAAVPEPKGTKYSWRRLRNS